MRHEYPGVARDMDRLSHEWRPERDLRPPNTAVERVLDALIRTVEMGEEPPTDLVQEEAEVLSEALERVGQINLPTSDVHHFTGCAVLDATAGKLDASSE